VPSCESLYFLLDAVFTLMVNVCGNRLRKRLRRLSLVVKRMRHPCKAESLLEELPQPMTQPRR